MQFGRGRSHVFQIAKYSAGIESLIDLGVERALPFVSEMMNGEAGNYRVKFAQVGERSLKIVSNDLDGRIATKAFPGSFEHGGREIKRHRRGVRVVQFDQREEAPIAGAEIKDASDIGRDELEQGRLAFDPVGDGVSAFQIVQCVSR